MPYSPRLYSPAALNRAAAYLATAADSSGVISSYSWHKLGEAVGGGDYVDERGCAFPDIFSALRHSGLLRDLPSLPGTFGHCRYTLTGQTLPDVDTPPQFPAFGDGGGYVCEGDRVSVDVEGFTFTARILRDDCGDAPDERQDGFWPSSDPEDCGFIGEGGDLAAAQEQAETIMAAWKADEWFYCGVVVAVSRNGIELDAHAASLWGIECNFPASAANPSPNDYLRTVANELLPEALGEARRALSTLCACGHNPDEQAAA